MREHYLKTLEDLESRREIVMARLADLDTAIRTLKTLMIPELSTAGTVAAKAEPATAPRKPRRRSQGKSQRDAVVDVLQGVVEGVTIGKISKMSGVPYKSCSAVLSDGLGTHFERVGKGLYRLKTYRIAAVSSTTPPPIATQLRDGRITNLAGVEIAHNGEPDAMSP